MLPLGESKLLLFLQLFYRSKNYFKVKSFKMLEEKKKRMNYSLTDTTKMNCKNTMLSKKSQTKEYILYVLCI